MNRTPWRSWRQASCLPDEGGILPPGWKPGLTGSQGWLPPPVRFMASMRVHSLEVEAPHEPPVERSVHAAGTFAWLGCLECSSRIRWIGPGSSLKVALQNLRHSRPSRRRPPEGGVPVHGHKARNECSGNSQPRPLPLGGGEGARRAGEGCSNALFQQRFMESFNLQRMDAHRGHEPSHGAPVSDPAR